jgi:hypothetical protein
MRIEEEIRRAWEELKKKKLAEKKEKERKEEEQSEEEKEKKEERGREGEKGKEGKEKEEKEGEKKEEKKKEKEGEEEEGEKGVEWAERMVERAERFEGSGERELTLPLLPISKPQAKPLEAIATKDGEEKEGKEEEKVFYKPKQAQVFYEMPKPKYEHERFERLAPTFERPKLERKPEAMPIKFSDGMVEQARMAKQEKLEKMAEESMVEVKAPKPLEIPKVETYYYKYRPIKKLFEEKEPVMKKYYEEEEEQI